jgi:hypothetical protein
MAKMKKMTLLWLVSTLFSYQCGSTKPPIDDRVKTISDRLEQRLQMLPENSRVLWQAVPVSRTVPLRSGLEMEFASTDDPRVRWGQYWVDAIDHSLRELLPSLMSSIPPPEFAVAEFPEINAYVTRVPICIKRPVRLESGPQRRSSDSVVHPFVFAPLVFAPNEGHFIDSITQVDVAKSCAQPFAKDDQAIQKTLEDLNRLTELNGGSCRLTLKRGKILATAACNPVDVPIEEDAFVFLTMSNQLVFFDGVFDFYTEEKWLVSLISHELAHYYLAHDCLSEQRTQFLYRDDPQNLQRVLPEALADQVALAELKAVNTAGIHIPLKGSQLSRSLLIKLSRDSEALAYVLNGYCPQGSPCMEACAEALSALRSDSTMVSIEISLIRNDTAAIGAAELLAGSLKTCLQSIPEMGSDDLIHFANNVYSISLETSSWLPANSWPDTARILALGNPRAVLDDLDQQIRACEQRAMALRERIINERVAYYTSEQEADEISLDLHTLVGITPSAGPERLIPGLVYETIESLGALGMEACLAARRAGWKNETGEWMPVSFEPSTDPHHNSCYRIFQMDRKINVWDLTELADRLPKKEKPVSWSDLHLWLLNTRTAHQRSKNPTVFRSICTQNGRKNASTHSGSYRPLD